MISNHQKWKQPSKVRRPTNITHEKRIKGQRKNMNLFIGVHHCPKTQSVIRTTATATTTLPETRTTRTAAPTGTVIRRQFQPTVNINGVS
jgi:hypothetical protein